MAFQAPLFNVPGQVASGDLSADQHKFVKPSSTGVVLAGNGEQAIGILQNDPDVLGASATVMSQGVSKVLSGAAFAIGAELASDVTARAVAGTTGERMLALALEAASGAGELVSVLVNCPGGQLN